MSKPLINSAILVDLIVQVYALGKSLCRIINGQAVTPKDELVAASNCDHRTFVSEGNPQLAELDKKPLYGARRFPTT